MKKISEKFVDVAIIGGGVSGLYSGWRLLTGTQKETRQVFKNLKSLKIKIFEKSNRVGGRLQTVKFKEMPSVNVELGGMRYKSNHKLVSSLCTKALNLDIENFYGNTDFYFIRNQSLRNKDFKQERNEFSKLPYSLKKEEKNKTPDELFADIWKKITNTDSIPQNRKEWFQAKQNASYKGKKLREHGFWNVILDEASNECVKLLRDTDGYDSNLVNWNAAEAFEAQLTESDYSCLTDGYEKLPNELSELFLREGGEIELNTEMLQFKCKHPLKYIFPYGKDVYIFAA